MRRSAGWWRGVAVATLVASAFTMLNPSHGALAATPVGGWRIAPNPSVSGSWYATTFGAGRFVVVGHGDVVESSTNAVTWRSYAAPAGQWQSVAYGAGKFVALSAVNTGLEEMTSSDGVHWVAQPGPSGEWTGITYGAGRFLAVSALGQLNTSTDGTHWVTTWTRSQFLLNSVTYGNGRFIAVDSADGDALISLNGFNWSFYTISTPGTPWFAISYGNGVFSAFSPSGLSATSMLGYVWVTHRASAPQQMNASAFGCNTFVATGESSGRVNDMIISHTGATWLSTPVPTDTVANWTGVTYGASEFVAVDTAGTIATHHVAGYCGPSVATPPRDVSGNIESGQVWTYQHPPTNQGGAPVDGYLVTITDGARTWTCHAPVYYQPNCIIKGLVNRALYRVTTQVHNRFGYSAPTDPEWVIPVPTWSLQAVTLSPTVSASQPTTIQVTGIIANSEGIYPQNPVTVHFGAQTFYCVASPFGECLINVPHPQLGRVAIWSSYTGYGIAYHSPTSYVMVVSK
ncbi:MAG: fibronectin type III domain-containing protein [Actinomycetota bacterium]|nr:fibronectin type III domain-containing protein [Actinomycetota bacterium]